MRIGSLFSGYGGLDLAVASVLGASVAWHVEFDKHPSAILAHHFADVPNYGDVSAVDWSAVEPVDILTGGFPCQDLSTAGKRAGLRPGTRSGLWEHMAFAIDQLRPKLVVIENVRGLLSAAAHSDVEPCPLCVGDDPGDALRALGAVLGDLADLGYDAQWCGIRAADAGAPHGRFRVFIVAHPNDGRRWEPDTHQRHFPVVDQNGDEPLALLPTPTAQDERDCTHLRNITKDAARRGSKRGIGLNHLVEGVLDDGTPLLPTPTPFTNSNNETPEEWLERRADVVKRTGTHHGLPLAVAAASITAGNPILQSDPMASLEDACSTPVPSAETTKELRTAPTVSGQTQLESPQSLPNALEGQQAITSGSQSGSSQGGLSERLLPTPKATNNDNQQNLDRYGLNLGMALMPDQYDWSGAPQLLPTPRATDGTKGGSNQRGSSGDLMLPSAAVQLLSTPTAGLGEGGGQRSHRWRSDSQRTHNPVELARDIAEGTLTDFGPYAAAVARWEATLGRPAPSPTEPGTNGKPRLSPAFVEWMMGLPAGWVTDVDIPRNAQLKALGNGVVPQQAALALRLMLTEVAS